MSERSDGGGRPSERNAGDWRGVELGSRTVAYDERDAILYALAVGAQATELDLVFEERLQVLPTFALTLAQWAPDALGSLGGFDTLTAVHGAQQLQVFAPLPRAGELAMSATVTEVWDKGAAAVFDICVQSEYFAATWSIFAPEGGGFGGERGPAKSATPEGAPTRVDTLSTFPTQTALYRLLGDRHHIHIDPVAAARIGAPRPIMHGLCTLAVSILQLARNAGAHPAQLSQLTGRFAAPVFPGDVLELRSWAGSDGTDFEVCGADGAAAISGARATFH